MIRSQAALGSFGRQLYLLWLFFCGSSYGTVRSRRSLAGDITAFLLAEVPARPDESIPDMYQLQMLKIACNSDETWMADWY